MHHLKTIFAWVLKCTLIAVAAILALCLVVGLISVFSSKSRANDTPTPLQVTEPVTEETAPSLDLPPMVNVPWEPGDIERLVWYSTELEDLSGLVGRQLKTIELYMTNGVVYPDPCHPLVLGSTSSGQVTLYVLLN